jgi:predicted permease
MFNLKLALRTLFRTPFVTAVAILSLGLGIGANGAIFSLFNQILLRPLPVSDPGALVNLAAPGPKSGMNSCGNAGPCTAVFSLPMFRDLEKQQTPFTSIAAHRSFGANFSFKGQSLGGDGLQVSGSYFPTLGLVPAQGRLLTPADDRTAGESPVAVLSHRYWQTRFNGDPRVVNDTIIINGHAFTIVGVAPEGFDGTTIGTRPQVFVPITMAELMEPGRKVIDNRRAYWVYLFARLKPGMSIESATAAINQPYRSIINDVEAPLQKGMSAATLERFKAKVIEVTPGHRGQSSVPDEAMVPLALLLGVTFIVLLSACANIANLLLAKAVGRTGEMAVRLSIGAARRQLISQLLGESILLAIFGGLFGLLVAMGTMKGVIAMMPADAGQAMSFSMDWRVITFLTVVTVGTGLLFGLFPALHGSQPNLAIALKGQAGQPGGARSAKMFRAGLATVQIMLSMLLLAVAGLFLKSLVNVNRVDLGIDTSNVITFGIAPELNGYPAVRSKQIFEQVEDEIGRLPGVQVVSGGLVALLAGNNWGTSVSVEGFKADADTDVHSNYNEIGPGFLKATGIRLIAGREFTRADTLGAPKVAIVNEAFARKFNLGANPVGKRMAQSAGNAAKLDIEIVGFAKDAKYSEVKDEVPPVFYTPYRQDERVGYLVYYVKTASSTDSVMAAIPPLLAKIDSTLPVADLKTLEQQVRDNVFQDRLVSTLATVFAGLATLLAPVGLYGVMAYTMAQRTREIGLRMALGADAMNIRSLVLRQVGWMTLIGGGVGLALATVAGILARSQLYNMERVDPSVLSGAAAVLGLVALLAGLIPAIRASRVDPMKALRYE